MNKKIILLNGPPHCGKDEAARLMASCMGTHDYKMSRPMKHQLFELFGFTTDKIKWIEANKDIPIAFFNGMTWRQVQIEFSEDFMKPRFGDDIFGKIAVLNVNNIMHPYITISDSGFRDEAVPIIKSVGNKNVLLVRIIRPGTSFDGDSRSYWDQSGLGLTEIEINNYYGTEESSDKKEALEFYRMKLKSAIEPWLIGGHK